MKQLMVSAVVVSAGLAIAVGLICLRNWREIYQAEVARAGRILGRQPHTGGVGSNAGDTKALEK